MLLSIRVTRSLRAVLLKAVLGASATWRVSMVIVRLPMLLGIMQVWLLVVV